MQFGNLSRIVKKLKTLFCFPLFLSPGLRVDDTHVDFLMEETGEESAADQQSYTVPTGQYSQVQNRRGIKLNGGGGGASSILKNY